MGILEFLDVVFNPLNSPIPWVFCLWMLIEIWRSKREEERSYSSSWEVIADRRLRKIHELEEKLGECRDRR